MVSPIPYHALDTNTGVQRPVRHVHVADQELGPHRIVRDLLSIAILVSD